MAVLITDNMLEAFAVTGSYAELGTRLREHCGDLSHRTALYQQHSIKSDDPALAALVREFNP